MGCNPHDFPSKFGEGIFDAKPGDTCCRCGIIFCPVAYDHDYYDPGSGCAVCGWDGT